MIAIAASDGEGGFEMSAEVRALFVAVMTVTALFTANDWITRQAARAGAQRTADAVAQAVAAEVIKATAAVRDCVTGELMAEMLDAAVGRARAYGQVAEVRLRAAAANGNARSNVAALRQSDREGR